MLGKGTKELGTIVKFCRPHGIHLGIDICPPEEESISTTQHKGQLFVREELILCLTSCLIVETILDTACMRDDLSIGMMNVLIRSANMAAVSLSKIMNIIVSIIHSLSLCAKKCVVMHLVYLNFQSKEVGLMDSLGKTPQAV